MRGIITLVLVFLGIALAENASAQNIIIQQNNQPVQKEPQVVEKIVEVSKKPEKPTSPVCLMGYLYVFPEAIQSTTSDIHGVVNQLNSHKAYGSDKWRVPNIGELKLVLSHKDKLHGIADIGNEMYISSSLKEIFNSGGEEFRYNHAVGTGKRKYDHSSWTGLFILIRTE